MSNNSAQQKRPNTDIPVEIIGYITDPKRVGYQILTNYESTYWRALVGNDAWGLYEVLRSFCHEGNDTCHPSINLLMDILDLSDRRLLIGRVTVTRGKERVLPGLIDVLQDYNLAVAEVKGEGPKLRYVFHVNLTPSVLTDKQVEQLPKRLQRKHAQLLQRVVQAVDKLDKIERKKRPSSGAKAETKGVAPIQRGVAPIHPPSGTHPPRTIPIEQYPKTTTVAEEKDNNNSSGKQDENQDVVVALVDRGISQKVAQRLAQRYSRECVFEKIDFLEYLQKTDPEKVKNPKGWLRRAIEENYGPPDGYKSPEERKAEEEEKERRRQELARLEAEEEKRRQEERERKKQEYAAWLAEMQERYGTTELELKLWPQALGELELQLSRPTYQAWFPQTQLLSLKEGEALIAVPNKYAKDWIEHQLADKIKRTLEGLDHPVERLKFVVIKPDGSERKD